MNTPLAQQLLAAPHVSFWLKEAIQKLADRDELDAARDAAKLAQVFPLKSPKAQTDFVDAVNNLLTELEAEPDLDTEGLFPCVEDKIVLVRAALSLFTRTTP